MEAASARGHAHHVRADQEGREHHRDGGPSSWLAAIGKPCQDCDKVNGADAAGEGVEGADAPDEDGGGGVEPAGA
jgi:hypothetical protein